MAVTLRSSSSAVSDSASSTSPAEPSGTAVGDWIIVIVNGNGSVTLADNNGSTAFTKTGQWQETTGNSTMAVFVREKQSGDPTSYNFTSTSTDRITSVAMAWQDGGNTFDVTPDATTVNKEPSLTVTFTANSITTGEADTVHIVAAELDHGTVTFTAFPSGYTEVATLDAAGQSTSIYYKAIATASSTGSQTWTVSGSIRGMTQSFSITSSGGGGSLSIPVAMHQYTILRNN